MGHPAAGTAAAPLQNAPLLDGLRWFFTIRSTRQNDQTNLFLGAKASCFIFRELTDYTDLSSPCCSKNSFFLLAVREAALQPRLQPLGRVLQLRLHLAAVAAEAGIAPGHEAPRAQQGAEGVAGGTQLLDVLQLVLRKKKRPTGQPFFVGSTSKWLWKKWVMKFGLNYVYNCVKVLGFLLWVYFVTLSKICGVVNLESNGTWTSVQPSLNHHRLLHDQGLANTVAVSPWHNTSVKCQLWSRWLSQTVVLPSRSHRPGQRKKRVSRVWHIAHLLVEPGREKWPHKINQ